jgi:hypothetical protein
MDDATPLATEAELAAINVARTALTAITQRALLGRNDQASGIVYGRATSAVESLVSTLSALRHWGEVSFSDDVLLNRAPVVAPDEDEA